MTTTSSGGSSTATTAAARSPTSTSPMSPKPTCRPGQANGSRRCRRFHPQLVLRLVVIRQSNVVHGGGQLLAVTAGAVVASVLLLRVRVIVVEFHRTSRIPSFGGLGTILPPPLPTSAGRASVATTATAAASLLFVLVIANNVWRVSAVMTCRTTRGGWCRWAHFGADIWIRRSTFAWQGIVCFQLGDRERPRRGACWLPFPVLADDRAGRRR